MRCYACDAENSSDVRFCTSCGTLIAPVTWAQPAPATAFMPGTAPAHGPLAGAASGAYADPTAYGAYATTAQQGGQAYASAAYPAGAAYPPYGYAPAQQIVNNINVAASAPASMLAVTVQGPAAPPLLLRILYFLCVGLWLGAIWTVLAWLLVASILGLPLGLYMLNRLPLVMTLKPARTQTEVSVRNGVVMVRYGAVPQQPLALRAAYFLMIGWWASLVWLLLTWALIVGTLGLGLPLAFWMVNRVPAITTLAR